MPGVPDDLRVALAERYDLERELGHGAMASVYLARDLRYDRRVAVKVLNEETAAVVGRERFRREIEIVARLNHPHILPLLDSGDAQGFLYYVMPYAEGGSLRDRLDRETQLELPAAIGIVRDVALALEHAHQLGFIHRDVKPENILFSNGYALIADFGIARVAEHVGDNDRLTQSGMSPGTPTYMSPEQAAGEGGVDGRSDLYSLACVLYELLAGQPPFSGPSVQAVLARHRFDPVPPLRTVRRTVSAGLERAVLRALEKVPADRQKSAAEFAAALAAAPKEEDEKKWWQKPRVVASVTLVGLLAVLVVIRIASTGFGTPAGAGLDTTRYLILPFERDSGVAPFHEEQLLQDAFQHWRGVTAVDAGQFREVVSNRHERLSTDEIVSVADHASAGRYVSGETSRVGDSLRLHVALHATQIRGPPLDQTSVMIANNQSEVASAIPVLVERLLFGEPGSGAYLDLDISTDSRTARQAFARGLDSVFVWNLEGADSAFNTATRQDPLFTQALLWLAQVRSWEGAPAATWQSAAERAAAGRDRLSARDLLISDALGAQDEGEYQRACDLWRRGTARYEGDFVVWYGLGSCLSDDRGVIRDGRSPSGWRFRASYAEAARAYVRAFRLLPSIHRQQAANSYLSVRRLLWTSADNLRPGTAVGPDTGLFAGYVAWEGDSLAFVPYRLHEVPKVRRPRTARVAIRKERELFHEIAISWVTAYPQSADALNALALSLELLGNPAGLDTIRRARANAATAAERIRTAAAEIWMRVKFGLPGDTASLNVARAIADSIIHSFPPGSPEPLLLASIASVTGRVRDAVSYSRDPLAAQERGVPPPLVRTALPLTVFSALGGPADSIRILEQQVASAITSFIGSPSQAQAREEWLARPATLAFPEHRFGAVRSLRGILPLLDALVAWGTGDTIPAHRYLHGSDMALDREELADRSIDVVYPEAWLIASLGDTAQAIAWLDPPLNAMQGRSPEVFSDLARAGVLVRAMSLRADLAKASNDLPGAKRWAAAICALWFNADEFLQPVVRRMRRLAG